MATHGVDRDRVVVVGFSQGANIALTLVQTRPDHLRGIVPVCGHYEPAVADSRHRVSAAAYLLTGELDPWKDTYRVAVKDSRRAGASARKKVVAGLAHEMPSGAAGERLLTEAIRWCLQGS